MKKCTKRKHLNNKVIQGRTTYNIIMHVLSIPIGQIPLKMIVNFDRKSTISLIIKDLPQKNRPHTTDKLAEDMIL